MDEHADGVRIKILPCPKEQLRRRLRETQVLGDDFYVPNRAQLMLKFLQQHGDRLTKEKPGPEAIYPGFFTVKAFPPILGCVCVCKP